MTCMQRWDEGVEARENHIKKAPLLAGLTRWHDTNVYNDSDDFAIEENYKNAVGKG